MLARAFKNKTKISKQPAFADNEPSLNKNQFKFYQST